MGFLDAFRQKRYPMDERLPDGSSVEELLMRQAQRGNPIASMGGQGVPLSQPAPQQQPQGIGFRAALSRPSTDLGQGSTFTEGGTGDVRARRTQPRDYLADDAAYYRDLQKQPRTWRDKLADVIEAVNVGAGGKPRILPTKRERELQRAGNQLGLDVEMQKQELNQMVPVTLEDGSQVMVPRRTAGTLQSNQQNIARQNSDSLRRKAESEARINRWERMDVRDRRRLIADLYKSGGLNSPEMLEYAADELGIPGALREKFIGGQMRDAVDADGNLVQVNRQTQQVMPVTQDGQPVGSYQKTVEQGRNRRAAASQRGALQRTRIAQEGQNQRAAMRGQAKQPNYAGRTMSQANLERYAKDKGLNVDDARKQVEGMGVKIQ